MSFVPLLLLFLLYLQADWPAPLLELTPVEAILLTIAAHACCLLAAAGLSLVCRANLRSPGANRSRILRTFSRGKFRIGFLAVAVFLGCLYGLGWGWAMTQLVVGWWTPLLKPLLLTPFLATMILSWFFYYETDRAAHDDFWGGDYHSRSAYILLHLRHHLLMVAPPLLLMMGQETLHLFVGDGDKPDESPVLYIVLMGALLAVALTFLPYLLRLLLGLRPLPSGPLRDHLLATAKRLRFRVSDILVWNTRHTQANALVTGMLPVLRYVVLTDRMLDEFSVDEIEAVFGHEVGHVKHHHMPFYAIFLILSLAILAEGYQLATGWMLPALTETGSFWAGIIDHREWFLGLVVVYMFICYGYMSRRCERQADLFGCRVAGYPAFISALEKVADLNGISRERPGWFAAWQHGTIAERVDFLREAVDRPELASIFQRRFAWLKWGSMASLVAAVAVIVAFEQWDWLKYL